MTNNSQPSNASPLAGKVAVVGAGLMGAEIGVGYAIAGFEVSLYSRTTATAADCTARTAASLANLTRSEVVTVGIADSASGRLTTTTSLASACLDAAIIVESVAEDFEAKVDVLRSIAEANAEAIVASNTSSLSISKLADSSGLGRRLIGTHYWNPPTLMPLVEVVAGASTDPAVVDQTLVTLRRMGKEPVLVPDIPGFVWNRLQFALLREAIGLVQHHGVNPATIDVIVRRGLGRRWSLLGPFETAALGGPETFAAVAKGLFPELENDDVDPGILLALAAPTAQQRHAIVARRNAGLARHLLARTEPTEPEPAGTGDIQ